MTVIDILCSVKFCARSRMCPLTPTGQWTCKTRLCTEEVIFVETKLANVICMYSM